MSNLLQITVPYYQQFEGINSCTLTSIIQGVQLSPQDSISSVVVEGFSNRNSVCHIFINGRCCGVEASKKSSYDYKFNLNPEIKFKNLHDLKLSFLGATKLLRIKLLVNKKSFNVPSQLDFSKNLFFKLYDRSLPLFFLHIFKCGGQSLFAIFQEWFQSSCYPHYTDLKQMYKPPRYIVGEDSVVFGHFARSFDVAIEDYYPEARQMITFIREPFSRAVSRYFFLKKIIARGETTYPIKNTLRDELEEHLSKKYDLFFSHLPLLKANQSIEDYIRTHFLYVGLYENLQQSVDQLALLLGKPRHPVPHVNSSVYDEPIPDMRKEFRSVFKEEYEFYDFIKEQHRIASKTLL